MNNLYQKYISKFRDTKVIVIGDAMLDRYFLGSTERICREAPVPIVDINDMLEMPGGAANATVNLATLNAQATFLSVVGNDLEGKTLIEKLGKYHINSTHIISDTNRHTMTKTRIIAKDQILIRFDIGNSPTLSFAQEHTIMEKLIELYPQFDAILVSDYGYGIVTERIRKLIKSLQHNIPRILIIDAKFPHLYRDIPATAIKPNYQEALSLLTDREKFPAEKRAQKIIENRDDFIAKVESNTLAITLDTEGAIVINRDGTFYRTHATPQPDSRAAGAGDTYVSAFLLSLAAGSTTSDAAEIAARAAYITIQKSATAFCTAEELWTSYKQRTKLLNTKSAYRGIISLLRQRKKQIVFTNGCFDILHSGHVKYLSHAKALGDILVVGINSDQSIKKIKGNTRPINTLHDRIDVLSGLSSIDYIIPFEENTPLSLIKDIHPDVYVKGGDYTKKTLPEVPIVEKYGGKVIIVPFIPEKSTTNIIQKIRSQGDLHAI